MSFSSLSSPLHPVAATIVTSSNPSLLTIHGRPIQPQPQPQPQTQTQTQTQVQPIGSPSPSASMPSVPSALSVPLISPPGNPLAHPHSLPSGISMPMIYPHLSMIPSPPRLPYDAFHAQVLAEQQFHQQRQLQLQQAMHTQHAQQAQPHLTQSQVLHQLEQAVLAAQTTIHALHPAAAPASSSIQSQLFSQMNSLLATASQQLTNSPPTAPALSTGSTNLALTQSLPVPPFAQSASSGPGPSSTLPPRPMTSSASMVAPLSRSYSPYMQKVKISCTHCKAAKTKCDMNRPCIRCVRIGTQDTCCDVVHKPFSQRQIKRKKQGSMGR